MKKICSELLLAALLILTVTAVSCRSENTQPELSIETKSQTETNETTALKPYTKEDIDAIIRSSELLPAPGDFPDNLTKYPTDSFIFNNRCFSFYRDMDYFLNLSAKYNTLGSIIKEYPPQVVRTIDHHGQKCMYFVYETEDRTRVFLFFFESDNFSFSRGYPIIMKKTLTLDDFAGLKEGDAMRDVEKIDPIAAVYRKGYDTLSDKQIAQIYVHGRETISSVHLLSDGIIRINYDRDSNGEYIVNQIIRSDDFTIPVLGGQLCYLIYPNDYIS